MLILYSLVSCSIRTLLMLPCILCYDDLATELVWAPCIQTTYNHYGLIKRNSSSLLCRNCGCQLSLSIPFLIKFKARCAASVLCYSDLAWAGWLNGGGQHTHTHRFNACAALTTECSWLMRTLFLVLIRCHWTIAHRSACACSNMSKIAERSLALFFLYLGSLKFRRGCLKTLKSKFKTISARIKS